VRVSQSKLQVQWIEKKSIKNRGQKKMLKDLGEPVDGMKEFKR